MCFFFCYFSQSLKTLWCLGNLLLTPVQYNSNPGTEDNILELCNFLACTFGRWSTSPTRGWWLLVPFEDSMNTSARSSFRGWFWQWHVVCLISPLAVESLPAALLGCPDWLGETFSTSSCSKGSLTFPWEKQREVQQSCQWCPGLQPLGSFGCKQEGVFPAVFCTLMSEWEGSAAFLKH